MVISKLKKKLVVWKVHCLVSKIAIKGISEATILLLKKVCDEYCLLGISEWITEGVKEVALLELIEIKMLVLTNSSKLG